VDALYFVKVLSDKCLHWSIVTRAHVPTTGAAVGRQSPRGALRRRRRCLRIAPSTGQPEGGGRARAGAARAGQGWASRQLGSRQRGGGGQQGRGRQHRAGHSTGHNPAQRVVCLVAGGVQCGCTQYEPGRVGSHVFVHRPASVAGGGADDFLGEVQLEVSVRLGRVVALYRRPSTSYQVN
jgi:hypothetical protein